MTALVKNRSASNIGLSKSGCRQVAFLVAKQNFSKSLFFLSSKQQPLSLLLWEFFPFLFSFFVQPIHLVSRWNLAAEKSSWFWIPAVEQTVSTNFIQFIPKSWLASASFYLHKISFLQETSKVALCMSWAYILLSCCCWLCCLLLARSIDEKGLLNQSASCCVS